jgi:transposase
VNSHKNAKLTFKGREEMIRRMGHEPAATVAAGFGVSLRTARKWMSRYRQGGSGALADKSSRPKRCRSKLNEQDVSHLLALRKERLTGDEIAMRLGFCRSSVYRALRRLGLSQLRSLEEKEPIRRYQWENPGQMLHLDIKKLGKIDGVGHKKTGTRQVRRRRPGWEYLHVCVDDASRAAYTAVLPDEKAESAVEFLWFAVAWYATHGIKVERVLTDNGACYKSWKFRDACRESRHKT